MLLRVLRPQLSGATMAVALLGCALVLLGAFLSTRIDAEIGVGLALLAAVFVVAATCGFLAYPHLAVAATVAVFALVPLLRWFTWPEVGGLKDLLVLAAFAAAVIVFAYERRLPDRWILILVAALLGLYAVNVGGGHGAEWAHGVRLVGEPLLLLLAGLMLPEPRRTFRYAMGALIITGCVVAAYGIVQQVAGPWTLVESWGYSFTEQVQILSDGQLRSFGTLDDAFAYAALLAFGVAAAIFWLRRGPLAWAVALLMLAGLAFSFVRTGALILVALAAVALARREYGFRENIAIVALLITVAMALAIGGETRDTPGERGQAQATTESDFEDPAGGTVGGRVEVWRNAIGSDPAEWLVGRGVGEAGTAASRASGPTIPSGDAAGPTESVDSGYVAAIVDVGVIGFAVLLGLLARLIVLAVRATGQKLIEGWIALALLVSLVVDALTRSSFTGFPTAFLCLFLVGIALAAAAEIRPPPNGLRSFTR